MNAVARLFARDGRSAPPEAECYELVLPADRVTLVSVPAPETNLRAFQQNLAYALEDRLLSPVDTLHVAVGPLIDGAQTALVVEREYLDSKLAELRVAGIHPVAAYPETLLLPWQEERWSVAIVGKGAIARTGICGGGWMDAVESAAPPALLAAAMDEARREGKTPMAVDVYVAEVCAAPDMEGWSAELGVPVTLAGQWLADAARLEPAVNMLQGTYAAPMDPATRKKLRRAVWSAAAVWTLVTLAAGGYWAALAYETSQLQKEINGAFREAFPGAGVVDAPLQMRRKLDELKRFSGAVDAPGGFMSLMNIVGPKLGKDAKIERLSYREQTLELELKLPGKAEADALLKALSAEAKVTERISDAVEGGHFISLTVGEP